MLPAGVLVLVLVDRGCWIGLEEEGVGVEAEVGAGVVPGVWTGVKGVPGKGEMVLVVVVAVAPVAEVDGVLEDLATDGVATGEEVATPRSGS